MVYRDDIQALEARRAVLEAEIAERARARDEVARMLAEARAREEAERRLAALAAGAPARRRRRRILIAGAMAMLAALGAGAAYRLTRPQPPDPVAQAIEQLALFTDQMCSCSTAACTQQVSDAMMEWARQMPRDPRPPTLDPAQQKRVSDLAARMGECTMRAQGGDNAQVGDNAQDDQR